MENKIIIKGAKQHNLKNLNLEIPKNKLVVITGLSGSGKSTLAFDTIFAEGQRRYVESLSAYARQFLQIMDKPDVDVIDGLSPAIAIQQKTTNKNPRSTVGTITEIYDYLRLLFSKIGIPYCPKCGTEISYQSLESIVRSILDLSKSKIHEGMLLILAPVIREKKGTYEKIMESLKEQGYSRIRVDKEIIDIADSKRLNLISAKEKHLRHSIEIVIDRISSNKILEEKDRVFEAVQNAIDKGGGIVMVLFEGKEYLFSQKNSCPICNISIGEMEPSFSFNSPFGGMSKLPRIRRRNRV